MDQAADTGVVIAASERVPFTPVLLPAACFSVLTRLYKYSVGADDIKSITSPKNRLYDEDLYAR